jgi:hypothetical protein
MIVKVQLLRDDGTVVYEQVASAHIAFGWETGLATGPVLDNDQKLYGFTYLPCPPPRNLADIAAFRELLARFYG